MKDLFIVLSLLINFISLNAQGTEASKNTNIHILKYDTKVYEEPNLSSNILKEIRNGNTVTVLNKGEAFTKVKYLKFIGYIKNTPEFVQKSANSKTKSETTKKDIQTRNSSTSTSSSQVKYKSSSKSSTKSTSYSSTCGARTKKGGSCRRRVSGGGRCWQH